MRLIDADELIENVYRERLDSRELVAQMVESAPTIKPERKTGRLIQESAYNWYRCSVCKKVYPKAFLQNFNECMYQPCFRYCPNCGARLEEGEADG